MKLTTQKTNNESVFGSVLAVALICLKLTGHIDWSWWLILLPVWAPIVLGAAIFAIIAAVNK